MEHRQLDRPEARGEMPSLLRYHLHDEIADLIGKQLQLLHGQRLEISGRVDGFEDPDLPLALYQIDLARYGLFHRQLEG